MYTWQYICIGSVIVALAGAGVVIYLDRKGHR